MPEAAAAAVVEFLALEGTAAVVAAAVTEVVVTAAISSAISSVVSGGSSGQGGTASARALSTTIRQSAAPRRLIYGTVKTGGVLLYAAQSTDGEYAHLAIYLGEGPIDGVDSVFWIGDELSTDAKFDGLLTMEVFTGAPGQTASAALIADSGGEWTSAHVGNGVAYVVVTYKWDRNAFPRGLVMPTFLVRGRKVATPGVSGTALSSNPALVMLDYIRSPYSYTAADTWIDLDTFTAAASVCDEVLTSADPENIVDGVPNRVKRYTINGVFEVISNPTNTVATIEAAMGGKLINHGGQYRLYAGAWRAPTGPSITAEYLRDDPSMRTHASRQQRLNIARGNYREPKQEWQTTSYREQRLPAAIIAEDGEIVQSIDYPATTNGATAQRLAKLAMMQARSSVPLSLPCNFAAFAFRLWDVVTIDMPEIGASGPHLITSYTYPPGGGIDMVAVPHLASDFAWDSATDEAIVPTLLVPDFNRSPPKITGLVVSGAPVEHGDGASIGLSASWTATVWASLKHYEVQHRVAGSGDSGWIGSTATTAYWKVFGSIVVGTEYDVRVRIVALDDTTGDWFTETNIEANGDTTPPGVPTDLSVTHHGTGAHTDTIYWTTPPEVDFSRSRVYVNTTNDPVTATEIAEIFGLPGTPHSTEYDHDDVDTHYYWVASVDRTGNSSVRTYAGGA